MVNVWREVGKYTYLVKVVQTAPEADVEGVRRDIGMLFGTDEVKAAGQGEFRVISEFPPDMAQKALRTLTAKYGQVELKRGDGAR